jgi:hypothetical protein
VKNANENVEVLRSGDENIEVLTNENDTTPDSHSCSCSHSPATNASASAPASDITESAPELEKRLLSLKK